MQAQIDSEKWNTPWGKICLHTACMDTISEQLSIRPVHFLPLFGCVESLTRVERMNHVVTFQLSSFE